MSVYTKIAVSLRRAREQPLSEDGCHLQRPLTQAALAARMQVSPATVAQYEAWADDGRGKQRRRPTLDRMQAWAQACGYELEVSIRPRGADAEVDDGACVYDGADVDAATRALLRQIFNDLRTVAPNLPAALTEDLAERVGAWVTRYCARPRAPAPDRT